MGRKTLGYLGIALLVSVWIGYLNTHTDEVTIILPFLLIGAFGLGFGQPGKAWLWGIIVGMAIPGSQALAYRFQLGVPYPNDWHDVVSSGALLVPALLAAYAGAAVRWLARLESPRSAP